MQDPRGVPVTCPHPSALDAFETALESYQTYVGDPVAMIDPAVGAFPDFVMGHVLKAGVLMTAGERRLVPDARASIQRAEALASRANDRERGLIRATRQLVDGDMHGACAAYDRVLVDYPRDAFALQTAHLFDFYRGDALNLRNRVSRVMPHWSPNVPGYSYVLGMHAFGFEECNQYPEAEAAGRRALEMEPRDGWAVHAVTHVMEMQGRIDEGIDWLESRAPDWSPGNGFAFHNWWHLALYRLDRHEHDAALALYDRSIYPEPLDACLVLVDATSLLWRLSLESVSLGDRPATLAGVWRRRIGERGFYAFNDVHATMAFALAGDSGAARDTVEAMQIAASAGHGTNCTMSREVGAPLGQAIVDFADGDYAGTIEHALPVRDHAHVLGGSHAQRDLITLTLIEAAVRSGQKALARHLIAERLVHKPRSQWGERLMARAA